MQQSDFAEESLFPEEQRHLAELMTLITKNKINKDNCFQIPLPLVTIDPDCKNQVFWRMCSQALNISTHLYTKRVESVENGFYQFNRKVEKPQLPKKQTSSTSGQSHLMAGQKLLNTDWDSELPDPLFRHLQKVYDNSTVGFFLSAIHTGPTLNIEIIKQPLWGTTQSTIQWQSLCKQIECSFQEFVFDKDRQTSTSDQLILNSQFWHSPQHQHRPILQPIENIMDFSLLPCQNRINLKEKGKQVNERLALQVDFVKGRELDIELFIPKRNKPKRLNVLYNSELLLQNKIEPTIQPNLIKPYLYHFQQCPSSSLPNTISQPVIVQSPDQQTNVNNMSLGEMWAQKAQSRSGISVTDLKQVLSKRIGEGRLLFSQVKMKESSVGMNFLALLHVANFQGLILEQVQQGSNIKIIKRM